MSNIKKCLLMFLAIIGMSGCVVKEPQNPNEQPKDDGSIHDEINVVPEPTYTPGPEVVQNAEEVVHQGTYELNFIQKNESDGTYDVAFDAPGANNTVIMNLSEDELNGFGFGSIVSLEYKQREVCPGSESPDKCYTEYEFISINPGTGYYTKSFTLSGLIGMTPVSVRITKSGSDAVVLYENAADIEAFLKKMDGLNVYQDCVEIYGAGGDVYTMEFTDAEGNTAIVKDSFNVEVEFSKESPVFFKNNVVLGVRRTTEDQTQYSTLLAPLFE